jgi:hypothetical protein
MMRKQEVIQFGPWLRANSSTRRMEKTQTHERMVGNMDLASFSHLALGVKLDEMVIRIRGDMGGKGELLTPAMTN